MVVGGGGDSCIIGRGVEIRVVVVASSDPIKLCIGRLAVEPIAMTAMMNKMELIEEIAILRGFLVFLKDTGMIRGCLSKASSKTETEFQP